MILVMLSPILIIGFIALGIFEERRRSKKAQEQKTKLKKIKIKFMIQKRINKLHNVVER